MKKSVLLFFIVIGAVSSNLQVSKLQGAIVNRPLLSATFKATCGIDQFWQTLSKMKSQYYTTR